MNKMSKIKKKKTILNDLGQPSLHVRVLLYQVSLINFILK